MDKKISLLTISIVLALPLLAFAQLHSYGNQAVDIRGLIHGIEMAAGLIFGAIAVICFVISGVMFLTAQGDSAKLQTARSSFVWGVAGVIVGIIAFSIIAIVGGLIMGRF